MFSLLSQRVTDVVDTFVGLLLAVAALGLLARKIKVAYPILLVLGGLALGLIPGLPRVQLSPEFIFMFFLPPLLYEKFPWGCKPLLLYSLALF